MSKHHKVCTMLYEYLHDDLPSSDKMYVEIHLTSCRECRKELDAMRSTLGMLASSTPASEERSGQFWLEFPVSVLREVHAGPSRGRNPFLETLEWMEGLFALHARYAFAATGTLAAILVVFALWTFRGPGGHDADLHRGSASLEQPTPAFENEPAQSTVTPERVSQYFRKSKTLLVGVANLRPDQAAPLDFSKERRVSRDLIQEARYLRQQPIDPRARQLMGDMERILIELSNLEGHRDPSGMDIIRSGIHHENLLFKIRMAETMYDSTRFMVAGDRR